MFHRVLDPLDRTSEILFGIIMVLTFTGSIRVADAGREEIKTILTGAIGCNLAWGVVDAATYLMTEFMTRARGAVTLRAFHRLREPEDGRRFVRGLLPAQLSSVLTPSEVETLRLRLTDDRAVAPPVTLSRNDWIGAAAVFLLVFLATFPVIVPLLIVRDTRLALLASNAVAIAMLFILGWLLGRYAGRPPWRTGLAMVGTGVLLVAITMALGG